MKTGPRWKEKVPSRGFRTCEPRMSVGRRSGVNCTRVKATPKAARERLGHRRLADARDVLDEHMAAAEDADEEAVDDVRLAVHDATERVADGGDLLPGVQVTRQHTRLAAPFRWPLDLDGCTVVRAVSLRSKLQRLDASCVTGPAAPPPSSSPPPPRAAALDELRQRIHAVLSRSSPPRPAPPVQTVELPFLTFDTPLGPLHVRTHGSPRRIGPAAPPCRGPRRELRAPRAARARSHPRGLLAARRPLPRHRDHGAARTGRHRRVPRRSGVLGDDRGCGRDSSSSRSSCATSARGPMLARVAERIARRRCSSPSTASVRLPAPSHALHHGADAAWPAEPPHLDLLHVARRHPQAARHELQA